MNRKSIFSLALFLSFSVFVSQAQRSNKIQVALLLDTSNSMDGLINQAKSQLWSVVNDLSTARYEGKIPEIEIALYEYGNDRLSASEGYIRQVVGLSKDLDKISDELFKLSTNGGNEYCGWVIEKSLKQLSWSDSNKDLKLIYIAGNEPYNQGSVDYKKVCKAAAARGIVINTIYCGAKEQGISELWKDGAECADGKYFNIDQNAVIAQVSTPYDKDLQDLNKKLNSTYIGYGANGAEKIQNQAAQDNNAMGISGGVLAERAATKASAAYSNESWDLIDGVKSGKVKTESLNVNDLPAEMKNMNVEQRKEYVEKKAEERGEIQKKITEISRQRVAYVAQKEKENAKTGSINKVMSEAAKSRAAELGYTFQK